MAQTTNFTIECAVPETTPIAVEAMHSVDVSNGGVFTPKGELRIAIVFAGYQPFDVSKPKLAEWPIDTNDASKSFPNYVNRTIDGFGDTTYSIPSLFYTDIDSFNHTPTSNDKTLSRYFYDMSRGQFKVIAEVYPSYVQLQSKLGFETNNTTVLLETTTRPNFRWIKFDNRVNRGVTKYFTSDNSTTLTSPVRDGKPDYIVIIYRDSIGLFGATGYGLLKNTASIPFYQRFDSSGFALLRGYERGGQTMTAHGLRNVFIHELCHTLYGATHQYGNNFVTGKRFSFTRGWSMMNHDYGPSSANAWERYMLGWINLGTEIKHITSSTYSRYDTLTDFVTTGKAIAIDIPNDTGSQRLWIEYRKGTTPWDKRDSYIQNSVGGTIPQPQPGVYAFVEDHVNRLNRNVPIYADDYGGTNAFKALTTAGAYDVNFIDTAKWNAWGNIYDYFTVDRPNPLSFSSQQWLRRWNLPRAFTNNLINNNHLEIGGLGSDLTEGSLFNAENGLDYWGDGSHYAFKAGERIGLDEIVVPASFAEHKFLDTNTVTYDSSGRIFLNGVSVEVVSIGNDKAILNIKTNDTDIDNNQRFTGNVVVPDLPNVPYGLNLKSCKTLTIDGSRVPNRLNKKQGPSYLGEFIDPTIFRLQGTFHQEKASETQVLDGSAFIVEDSLYIEGGVFHVYNYSSLIFKPGSTLVLGPKASLIIDEGAYLYFDPSNFTTKFTQGNYFSIDTNVILTQKNPFVKFEVGDLPATLTLTKSQVASKFNRFSLLPTGCDGDPYYYCNMPINLRLNTPYTYNTKFYIDSIVPSTTQVIGTIPSGRDVSV